MPRKSKKPVRKQTHSPTGKVVGRLPMIAGIAATKADLTEAFREEDPLRASVESDLGGGIDPKLRIESGAVSWHE